MPVILSAPGTGKSHWIKRHAHWSDQQNLTKIHRIAWTETTHSEKENIKHYKLLDAELAKITKTHYVLGSLFWEYVPDAIVLIDEKTHRQFINKRNKSGIEPLDVSAALEVARFLKKHAAQHKIPVFDSFGKAAQYIYWNKPIPA